MAVVWLFFSTAFFSYCSLIISRSSLSLWMEKKWMIEPSHDQLFCFAQLIVDEPEEIATGLSSWPSSSSSPRWCEILPAVRKSKKQTTLKIGEGEKNSCFLAVKHRRTKFDQFLFRALLSTWERQSKVTIAGWTIEGWLVDGSKMRNYSENGSLFNAPMMTDNVGWTPFRLRMNCFIMPPRGKIYLFYCFAVFRLKS